MCREICRSPGHVTACRWSRKAIPDFQPASPRNEDGRAGCGRPRRPGRDHRLQAARNRPLTRGRKLSNKALAAVRAPVEHGFAHLKNWRVLGKVRTDPKRATDLVRALLVLTNREVARVTDDLRRGHPPATSTSTRSPAHTRPVASDFTMHSAL
ncbi:transposase family protein [Streptomyces sp. NPDC020801]|uniref:transposase family protein n=1 Tax=unclassified Streptomyces TaxID=2593676 RepID=UPI003788F30B